MKKLIQFKNSVIMTDSELKALVSHVEKLNYILTDRLHTESFETNQHEIKSTFYPEDMQAEEEWVVEVSDRW